MVAVRQAKRFSLGRLLSTPGALEAIRDAGQDPLEFLLPHMSGDWGEVSAGDAALNDEATEEGSRIHSAYRTSEGARIWVITECDRSVTTLLLPDEY